MKTLLDKDLYRSDEVAEYFSVSRKTIYKWIEQGILDAVKKGGIIRITRKSIINYQNKGIT